MYLSFLDSRRQEGAAGTGTDVNVQLLAAIKSLQDQVADLQAKSTQAVAATNNVRFLRRKHQKSCWYEYFYASQAIFIMLSI